MRKPLMAAAVAGILGIVPVAGNAANVNAGLCELRGVANFATPIHAAPDSVEFTFSGTLACTGVAGTDTPAPGYVDDLFGGDISAMGVGSVGCAGGASSGGFDVTILREPGLRDIWHGNFSTVSVAAATGLFAQVIGVEHQHYVEDDPATEEDESGWVSDGTDGAAPTLGGGVLTFNGVDPLTCLPDAGLSEANFSGEIAYAFGS